MLDTKTGQHTSPWIELTGELPTARRLVVPCCVAHGLIPRKDRIGKLGEVAISGVFMGYPRQQQGGAVLIWKPNEPNKYYTVYSVRFDESKTYRDAWHLGKEVSTAYGRDHHTEPFIYEEEPRSGSNAEVPMADYRGYNLPAITMPPAPQSTPHLSSSDAQPAEDEQTPLSSQGNNRERRSHVDLCATPGCKLKKFHLGNCSVAEPTARDGDPDKTISQRLTRGRGAQLVEEGGPAYVTESDTLLTDLSIISTHVDESTLQGITLLASDSPEVRDALHRTSDHFARIQNSHETAGSFVTDTTDTTFKHTGYDASMNYFESLYLAQNNGSREVTKPVQKKLRVKQCMIEDILRNINVPRNLREALNHEFADDFIEACKTELASHDKNGTYTLRPREPWMNVIGSTWAFDIKRDMNKRILRFKARLCAQGFSQVKGIDYFRKFSHTIPLDSLRLFLAKCNNAGLEIYEADYVTAYLNAMLDAKVFMLQAPGFPAVDKDGNVLVGPKGELMVCELNKSIYGLVQSGLMWEIEHHGTVKKCHWEQCPGEPCIFRKKINDTFCYMCTYVDNIWWGFPPNTDVKAKELELLAKHYNIVDLGPVAFSLGARVVQNLRLQQLALCQTPMIDEMINTYASEITEPMRKYRSLPCYPDVLDIVKNDPDDANTNKWRLECLKLGGKLNYIACFTRPDISAALSFCMRNVSGAGEELYNALLIIVRYLRDTRTYSIRYGTNDKEFRAHLLRHATDLREDLWSDFDVVWLSDASYGGPRPMACAIAFIGGAPFAWKIGRLECTSLSSCESEWFAQTIAAKLNQGLIYVFQFLHIDVKLPIIFFCDNKAAVQLAEADRSTKRMRHVLTRLAYLEEQIDAKHLIMLHMNTTGMIADIGTKVLPASIFHSHRVWLVRD